MYLLYFTTHNRAIYNKYKLNVSYLCKQYEIQLICFYTSVGVLQNMSTTCAASASKRLIKHSSDFKQTYTHAHECSQVQSNYFADRKHDWSLGSLHNYEQ